MLTRTHSGRKLKVKKGKEWGYLETFINGVSQGSWMGTDQAKTLEQLCRDIDAADIRRATDPDAYRDFYYWGAPKDIETTADAAFLKLYGWNRSDVVAS